MDKRPLPYCFIINHRSASEVTKRLKLLGFSSEKIFEAKKLRRKHKLSLYGCNFKKRWGYTDIQQLKKMKLQLIEERKSLLQEIELYGNAHRHYSL